MYGITIFDRIKMPLNWSMIYYGINTNQLKLEVAQEFVSRKLECNQQLLEEEMELLWKIDDKEKVLDLIKKVLNQKKVENISYQSKEKVLVALVIELRRHKKDISELLEKIDMLYEDLEYPSEMDGFISYMPMEENDSTKNISEHERYRVILKNIDDFINQKATKYGLTTVL